MNTYYLVIGLIIGFIIGLIFMFILNPKKKQQQALIDELKVTKAALASQQEELATHFSDSAELLDKMAQDFRNLYQHMAKNSEAILNKKRLPIIGKEAEERANNELAHSALEDESQKDKNHINLDEATDKSHEHSLAKEEAIDESHENSLPEKDANNEPNKERSSEVQPEEVANK